MISIVSSIYENLILFIFVKEGLYVQKRRTGFAALFINIVLLSVMDLCNVNVYVKVPTYIIVTTLIYTKVLNKKINVIFFKVFLFLLVVTLCDVFTMSFFELVSHTNVELQMQNNEEIEWILMGCSKLLCSIILTVFNRQFKFGKEKIYISIYLPFILNLLIVFILGDVILVTGETAGSRLVVVVSIVAFLASFVSLYLTECYLEIKDIERHNQLSILQMENQYKYYKAKGEEQQNIQSIRHDLKNHLLALEAEVPEKQKEYLNKLLSRVEAYGVKYNTGNKMIDVLLMEKTKVAEENQMDVNIMLEADALTFIDSVDIVTILGNLLDNSIEACQRNQIHRKYVFLNGRIIESFYVLVCKNSYNNPISITKGGHFATSKSDKRSHGIGLENIKQVVKKYNGNLNVTYDENEFIIKIIFPIVDESTHRGYKM